MAASSRLLVGVRCIIAVVRDASFPHFAGKEAFFYTNPPRFVGMRFPLPAVANG
jgi:hypothetical protein